MSKAVVAAEVLTDGGDLLPKQHDIEQLSEPFVPAPSRTINNGVASGKSSRHPPPASPTLSPTPIPPIR